MPTLSHKTALFAPVLAIIRGFGIAFSKGIIYNKLLHFVGTTKSAECGNPAGTPMEEG